MRDSWKLQDIPEVQQRSEIVKREIMKSLPPDDYWADQRYDDAVFTEPHVVREFGR